MERPIKRSTVGSKIQVQGKNWRMFVTVTTLEDTLVELQHLCIGQILHAGSSFLGSIDSSFILLWLHQLPHV